MFNKLKSFCVKAVSKVKGSFKAVESGIADKAHEALDGTKAEAYVDTGVKISKIGFDYKDLTMKEIEIDYLCIPSDRFEMNDEIEGTFEDWQNAAQEYENDTSILLVKNDELIGYCDMYPVTEEAYADLISGKVIIRDSMIDLFCMGGDFDVYISMVGIVPQEATQANYLMIFDWIFNHLDESVRCLPKKSVKQ